MLLTWVRFRCKFVGKAGQFSVQLNMGHFARKMTHVERTNSKKNKGIQITNCTGDGADKFLTRVADPPDPAFIKRVNFQRKSMWVSCTQNDPC